ncbi:TenA family protein [Rubrobacter indicoceani]|uniref:TenA family protein n=1 Tax=Rubrobacter indicoceani TaxID=2051957 RepID=UPI000E5B72EC|nr:TenA family protein [Rubrobacter indicoceani]
MSLSKSLWRENEDLARAALGGGFVRGLADGTLPIQSFRHYVAEDAFFLESFARAYALALVHCPDRAGLADLSALISGVLEELSLHSGYAAEWGVELSGISPAPATLAYTEFLLATASLQSIGETCAAMTPCMRLYAYLGQALAESVSPEENRYAGWIETYADPEFEGLAQKLEELLDRYAADNPAVRGAYRRAMRLEVAFFEAAFGVGKGG